MSEIQKQTNVIAEMFDNIAPKYDFLNSFFSVGIDSYWRKATVDELKLSSGGFLLDVAAGTADLSIAACRRYKGISIVGIDISEGMLSIGRQKVVKHQYSNIDLVKASVDNIPYEDSHFDAVMVAFGVRNFEHLEQGLIEMRRVVKPGAKVVILEFSTPKGFMGWLFNFYFRHIMPVIGKWVSSDNHAYQYLPQTVKVFSCRDEFLEILRKCGYTQVSYKSLTGGIATVYVAIK